VKEEYREVRGIYYLLESVLQDLRIGLRMLAKNSGFAAVAILTLALGIGANTAIFTVVNALLLKPLPYERPSTLTLISSAILFLFAAVATSYFPAPRAMRIDPAVALRHD
jgi:hypothetical protein